MLDFFKSLKDTFFVALLLETTKRLLERLLGLYANFRHENPTSSLL